MNRWMLLLVLLACLAAGCGRTPEPAASASAAPEASTQESPAEAVIPTRRSARDPFARRSQPSPAQRPSPLAQPGSRRSVLAGKDPFVGPDTTPAPRPPLATRAERRRTAAEGGRIEKPRPPDFEARSLIRSPQGLQAVVAVDNQTRTISAGQFVAGYRVVQIDAEGLTVTRSGELFRVKIKPR